MLKKLARVLVFVSALICLSASVLAASEFAAPVGPKCLPKKSYKAKLVTHYYVPLLKNYNQFVCDEMEGTCIYEKSKDRWLHNYGYNDERLSSAKCKNGYGNRRDCLHPCRVLAASMSHHRYGEILYFPKLVGMKCGNKEHDGFDMIHDGYMVVLDTGSPTHFNTKGRFDFFWGRCKNTSNGVCWEGPTDISQLLTNSDYCTAWDPGDPLKNTDVELEFVTRVRQEAIARGDNLKAADFELESAIGPAPKPKPQPEPDNNEE